MFGKGFRQWIGIGATLVLASILLAACGSNEAPESPTAEPTVVPPEPTAVPPAPTEESASDIIGGESELVVIENGDGPPFYARFGENETFGTDDWVAIVFYRDPNCVPDEFNLNQFFDFPGETGPGAFGCQPATTDIIEHWVNGPETDPAPAISEMSGRGAVPV